MSSTIATLAVKIIADTASFQKEMDGAAKKAQNIGSSMKKVGGLMTAGVTLPLVGVGLAAVNMASDVDESMSKVQQLFGDSSKGVIDWSATTAGSFGIAQADALAFSGELGNVLIAQGLAGDKAAELSTNMVELAADMASFNNASPEETFAAIQAGAIGSSEPLRKYGVVLSEATVQQMAMEMTGKTTTEALTEQDKTLARLAIITQQTSAAHGDFAKTSDGLANQQRITTAMVKDQAAALGKELLPIGLQVIGMVRQAITWFTNLSGTQKKAIVVVLAVVAAIGPLIAIIGSLMSALSVIIPVITAVAGVLSIPLILIIGAVIAIVALLVTAWKKDWGGIQEKTRTVVAWLKEKFDFLIEGIKLLWDKAKYYVDLVRNKFVNSFGEIKKAVQWVIDKVNAFIEKLSKIKLPSFLQRHSPSEFEQTLMGISSLMDELNRKKLPDLSSNLSGMGNTTKNYYLTYQGAPQHTEADLKSHLRWLEMTG